MDYLVVGYRKENYADRNSFYKEGLDNNVCVFDWPFLSFPTILYLGNNYVL